MGATNLSDVSPADLENLRAITGLFEILERKPVYPDGLSHCLEMTESMLAERAQGRLVRDVAAALLADVSDAYRGMGRDQDADLVLRSSASIRRGTSAQSLIFLMSILSHTDFHTIDPRVVSALAHTLLSELGRAPHINRPPVLAAVTVAVYQSGNQFLLPRVVGLARQSKTSSDLRLLLEALRPDRPPPTHVGLSHATRYANIAQIAAEHDPAFAEVAKSAWDQRSRLKARLKPGAGDLGLAARAAEAARGGDYISGAKLYDELAGDRSLSAEARAQMMVYAMCARLLANLVVDEATLEAEIDRLVRGRVLHARSVLDLPWAFNLLLDQAVEIHGNGGSAIPIARIFDLAAECAAGAAVRHDKQKGQTDVTLMTLMTRDAEGIDLVSLAAANSTKAFVWLRVFQNAEGLGVLRCVLEGSTGRCRAYRHDLDPDMTKVLARSSGDTSYGLTDDEVDQLSDLFFGDLSMWSRELVLIPDPVTWDIPWSLIAPQTATVVQVMPSAAAFQRLTAPRSGPKTVIGVFDENLVGARLELAKLTELANRGLLALTKATSDAELADLLARNDYDMLIVAVHGNPGSGFQYRMMLPVSATSPASLLKMRLPPIVVLGSCWSAQSNEIPDSVATTVGCLAAGASAVVGGLWAIDDTATGMLMTELYERCFSGQPLGEAFRAAYWSVPAHLRREAAAIAVVGRT